MDLNDKYEKLRSAAREGRLDKVTKHVRGKGNSVNPPRAGVKTAIQLAAGAGHLDVVEFLNNNGANVDVGYEGNPLLDAASAGHLQVVQYLEQQGANMQATHAGNTALHLACRHGRLEVVRYLLTLKACQPHLHMPDLEGKTPIMMAAVDGHLEVYQLLRQAGADGGMVDQLGHNVLHLAAMNGNTELVVTLMDTDDVGQYLHGKKQNGHTPLHVAAHLGQLPVLHALLRAPGAPVNVPDAAQNTPLHLAASSFYCSEPNRVRMLTDLLAVGADPSLKNKDGMTAARLVSSPEALQLLQPKPAANTDATQQQQQPAEVPQEPAAPSVAAVAEHLATSHITGPKIVTVGAQKSKPTAAVGGVAATDEWLLKNALAPQQEEETTGDWKLSAVRPGVAA